MIALEDVDRTIFAAHLTPHRSLDRRSARLVTAGVGVASIVAAFPFAALGAWPIVGFFGVDACLLWLAFRANFHAAQAYEDVRVTPVELDVAQVSARGRRREWRFNPSWVRLVKVEDVDYGLTRLSVASGGRQIEIGGFLGAAAREEFAKSLARALAEAKRGPRFS